MERILFCRTVARSDCVISRHLRSDGCCNAVIASSGLDGVVRAACVGEFADHARSRAWAAAEFVYGDAGNLFLGASSVLGFLDFSYVLNDRATDARQFRGGLCLPRIDPAKKFIYSARRRHVSACGWIFSDLCARGGGVLGGSSNSDLAREGRRGDSAAPP